MQNERIFNLKLSWLVIIYLITSSVSVVYDLYSYMPLMQEQYQNNAIRAFLMILSNVSGLILSVIGIYGFFKKKIKIFVNSIELMIFLSSLFLIIFLIIDWSTYSFEMKLVSLSTMFMFTSAMLIYLKRIGTEETGIIFRFKFDESFERKYKLYYIITFSIFIFTFLAILIISINRNEKKIESKYEFENSYENIEEPQAYKDFAQYFPLIRDGRTNTVKKANKKILLSARNYYGNTLLHEAAKHGRKEIVLHLINSGLDLNAKNDYGQSPLILAAIEKNKEMVNFLITLGADTKIKDHWEKNYKVYLDQ